jgi:hypothetical protein
MCPSAGVTAVLKSIKIPLMYQAVAFSYDGAQLVIWCFVEASVTIMAASIPVLRVLFIEARSSRYTSKAFRLHQRKDAELGTSPESSSDSNRESHLCSSSQTKTRIEDESK